MAGLVADPHADPARIGGPREGERAGARFKNTKTLRGLRWGRVGCGAILNAKTLALATALKLC